MTYQIKSRASSIINHTRMDKEAVSRIIALENVVDLLTYLSQPRQLKIIPFLDFLTEREVRRQIHFE
jgi:hypothetical protein